MAKATTWLFCAGVAAWFAGCTAPDAAMIVTVTSTDSITLFTKLEVKATANGRIGTTVLLTEKLPTTIPPDYAFGIDVPGELAGPFSITVTALDDDERVRGSGEQTGIVVAGKSNSMTVSLMANDASVDLRADDAIAMNRDMGNDVDQAIAADDLGTDDLGTDDLGTDDLGIDDLGTDDLAASDLRPALDLVPPVDMLALPDLVFVPPSCVGLSKTCGSTVNIDCCDSPTVPGGTFYRNYDVSGDGSAGTMGSPATLSPFKLDRYEVTVGRFRKFVEAGKGNQASPPATGSGVNAHAPGTGWNSAWTSELTASTTALTTALACDAKATWTASSGANEHKPINCLTWYEALAFCAWDGGYLPTTAQWNFAAAGGDQQRVYPWSAPASSVTVDCTYANYQISTGTFCGGPGGAVATVGSLSPLGDGRWNHADLGGNMIEWMFDVHPGVGSFPNPCTDCVNTSGSEWRVARGGGFDLPVFFLRGISNLPPATRSSDLGFRCAR